MARIVVVIGTPEGSRILAASSERDAATAAEAVVRRLDPLALPAPVRVACDEPAVADRLLDYLAGVQAELVRI